MTNPFEQLHPTLREALTAIGIIEPTHAQRATLEHFREEKKHFVLVSETGSGKTEAAMIPILNEILSKSQRKGGKKGILVLYITPLRALNRDMFGRLFSLCEKLKLNVGIRHGDTSQHERRKQLKNPPEILITTPETLQIALVSPKFREHLRTVNYVIIDEIHELAESKRGSQLVVGLERLRKITQHEFLRIGLSATVSNPSEIGEFLVGIDRDYSVLNTTQELPPKIQVMFPKPREEDEEIANKANCSLEAAARLRVLIETVKKHDSVLVFTNTRQFAEILGNRLLLLDPGFTFTVHHGSLAKEHRISAETSFKSKTVNCIICTSSLELGIDIGHVDAVIQFMSPRQVSPLLQRVGRSRHQLGRQSIGYIISVSEEDALESAIIAKKAIEGDSEKISPWERPLDVLAHQLVGLVQEYGHISVLETLQIIRRTYVFRNLTMDKLLEVAELLDDLRVLRTDGFEIRRSSRTREFYFDAISMIVDTRKYEAWEATEKRLIALLDDKFVESKIDVGDIIVVKGSLWKVVEITDDRVNLVAAPPTVQSVIPSWVGELIPIPYEVAQDMANITYDLLSGDRSPRYQDLSLSDEAREQIEEFFKKARSGFATHYPREDRLIIEKIGQVIILHSYLGSKGNETLGRLLASVLMAKYKQAVSIATDAYRVIIESAQRISGKEIFDTLKQIKPEHAPLLLRVATLQSDLFLVALKAVAQRMGLIEKKAEINKRKLHFLAEKYKTTVIGEEAYHEIEHGYYDLDTIHRWLSQLQENNVEILTIFSKINEPTLLANEGLKRGLYEDFIKPQKPTKEIVKIVKKRLLNVRLRLVCMYCGNFNATKTVAMIHPPVRCPKCNSSIVAAVHEAEKEVVSVIRKNLRREELDRGEKRMLKRALQSANLLQQVGHRAAIALAARGVGPETASRVLRTTINDSEEHFIMKLIEAETEYARTRPFWD